MAITINGGGGGTASLTGDASGLVITNTDGALTVPTGNTDQRPGTPAEGMVRFNTDNNELEQYNGSEWGSVGGAVTPAAVSDQANTSTGYFDLPAGNSDQRPGSPAAGMVRYNTTTGNPEWYDANGSQWLQFSQGSSYEIEYLVIGGGGGGGATAYASGSAGGGGAGGYRSSIFGESSGGGGSGESAINVSAGNIYSISIGAGGAGAVSGSRSVATSGTNTIFDSITSVGGGGGGASSATAGASGGSGGGGGWTFAGGSGTLNQGYTGGSGGGGGSPYGGGGGGGAGAAALDGHATAGGIGVQSLANGSATYRAGGGGGGGENIAGGAGGTGGGGDGSQNAAGLNGTDGTGGGGGGAGGVGAFAGGNGGSGLVIIRYAGSQRGTGGTITSSGGYTIHTFTSSGTFTA